MGDDDRASLGAVGHRRCDHGGQPAGHRYAARGNGPPAHGSGTIAGCFVRIGVINRQGRVRVIRDGVGIYDGVIGSLRRFKDDVKEVKDGFECGISVANFNDVKVGDVLECYRKEVVARTVHFGFDWVSIYAASSLRQADQAVHSLVLGLWLVVPMLVALAAVATWFLTGRALRPVDVMRRELDAVQSAGTGQRLAPQQRAAELDRLADTLNGMLDRISASDAIRRQFLADASHELRSPLASARAMLEVGLAYPDRADWPDTAGEVMVEVERLQSIAGELLALARAEGGERALKRESLELGGLVSAEVQRCNDDRVSLHVASPAEVSVDRDLVVRLIRNLLDNARRHAHSRVTVSVAGGGGVATVQVHNDGDEISEDQRELIFEPFTRLDNARARDEGGAGLGLSIARRIAEVNGGSLVAVGTAKGAAFVFTLPMP